VSIKTTKTMSLHRIAAFSAKKVLQPSFIRHGGSLRVILLSNLDGVGTAGEELSVAPGYMRNFLYPRQIAAYRTDENLEKYKSILKVTNDHLRYIYIY
jgi:hypothetical protein